MHRCFICIPLHACCQEITTSFGPVPHVIACFHADSMVRQFINDNNGIGIDDGVIKKKRRNAFPDRDSYAGERAYPFLPLGYFSSAAAFYRSIFVDCCYVDAARYKYVRVEDTGFYRWQRERREEEGARRQIVLNKSRHCSGLFSPRAYPGLFSRSFHCTRRSSPSSSLRSTFRCSFRPPAFSTFVNVVVLSSDSLVARISKRLIMRYLTAIVIYNFHYIIRRFVKLIAPLESLCAIISYPSQPYSLNVIGCEIREYVHVMERKKKNFILYIFKSFLTSS